MIDTAAHDDDFNRFESVGMALRRLAGCRPVLCTATWPNTQIRTFAIAARVHETNGTSQHFEPPTPELKRGEVVVVTSGKGTYS